MKLVAYSIHDMKAEAYATPFFSPNDLMAKRNFADLARDPLSTIHKNPEDFRLFRVGEFVNDDGTLIQSEIPQLICEGTEFAHTSA